MPQAIHLRERFSEIESYFSPKVIESLDDHYVKLAKIKGQEVPWHNHRHEDELFYIVEGSLLFEIENEPSFTMRKGDLFIVKKGVNHRVSSEDDCLLMLIERKTTRHTGDVDSPITKSIEEQKR
jgi:mannose-6-phosphate isomerase-like protein (cupin superfamily)